MIRRWPPNTISASAAMTQARMLATIQVSSLRPVRERGPLSTRMPMTGASLAGAGAPFSKNDAPNPAGSSRPGRSPRAAFQSRAGGAAERLRPYTPAP